MDGEIRSIKGLNGVNPVISKLCVKMDQIGGKNPIKSRETRKKDVSQQIDGICDFIFSSFNAWEEIDE